MSDPAVEAAQQAWDALPDRSYATREQVMEAAAREALKPIKERLAVIRERYELIRTWMLADESPAAQSRHASEMTGLRYVYNLIAPMVYPSEELEKL